MIICPTRSCGISGARQYWNGPLKRRISIRLFFTTDCVLYQSIDIWDLMKALFLSSFFPFQRVKQAYRLMREGSLKESREFFQSRIDRVHILASNSNRVSTRAAL